MPLGPISGTVSTSTICKPTSVGLKKQAFGAQLCSSNCYYDCQTRVATSISALAQQCCHANSIGNADTKSYLLFPLCLCRVCYAKSSATASPTARKRLQNVPGQIKQHTVKQIRTTHSDCDHCRNYLLLKGVPRGVTESLHVLFVAIQSLPDAISPRLEWGVSIS